jgi:hypothetical protein
VTLSAEHRRSRSAIGPWQQAERLFVERAARQRLHTLQAFSNANAS